MFALIVFFITEVVRVKKLACAILNVLKITDIV